MLSRRRLARLSLLAASIAVFSSCAPARSLSSAAPSPAAPELADLELVESVPVETTLDHPDVPNASDVWVAMIDRARTSLEFAEFYASEADGDAAATSALAPVLAALERATARGVQTRFLADAAFASKYPATLERLSRAKVDVRKFDMKPRAGGVLHAKYFVVDGVDAFLGSQNFDWRALSHIFEMGVRIRSVQVSSALLDIFETDWALAGGGPSEVRMRRHPSAFGVLAKTGERFDLVASPSGWLPDETSWDLPRIVELIGQARTSLSVQVLTYKTSSRDGAPFPALDDALRQAAGRGVRVRLMVSEWGSKPGSDGRTAIDDLSHVPGIDVRVIMIPAWSGGEVPFARVAHAKYAIADAATAFSRAWVGTSNWEGDYFLRSRNVGVIASGGRMPFQLQGVFDQIWGSDYAKPLASLPAASKP